MPRKTCAPLIATACAPASAAARANARANPAGSSSRVSHSCVCRLTMTISAWTRASRITVAMRSRNLTVGCRLDAVFVRVLEDSVEKAELSVRRRERSEVTHLDLVAFTLDRSDRVGYPLQLSEGFRLEQVAGVEAERVHARTRLDPWPGIGSWPARAERGRGRDQRDARAARLDGGGFGCLGGGLAYAGDRHPELAQEVEVSSQPFDPVVERVIAGRGEQVEARREQLAPALRSGQVDADPRRGWSLKFVQQDFEVGERHLGAPNEVNKSPPPRIIDRIRLRDQRVAAEGNRHRTAPASCADHWRSGIDCPKRKVLSGSYLRLTSSNRG